jgi:hypothetical protein
LPYLQTIHDMNLDIKNLRITYDNVLNEYTDFLSLRDTNKQKRSILGLGKVFRFLFGTADDGDVQSIKRNVNKLASTQKIEFILLRIRYLYLLFLNHTLWKIITKQMKSSKH